MKKCANDVLKMMVRMMRNLVIDRILSEIMERREMEEH